MTQSCLRADHAHVLGDWVDLTYQSVWHTGRIRRTPSAQDGCLTSLQHNSTPAYYSIDIFLQRTDAKVYTPECTALCAIDFLPTGEWDEE
jgi:hypothetical protein